MSKHIGPHFEPTTRLTVMARPHPTQRRELAYPQLTAPVETMPANRLDLYSWIDLLAESVRVRTSAIGAAVALTSGEELRCCGSAGSAPPKGIVVSEESTLVGECVRTREMIRCVDAVSNGISAASVLLAPIIQRGEVIGVFGLFWCDPHAISDANVAIASAATAMITASLGSTYSASTHTPVRESIQVDASVEAEARQQKHEDRVPVAAQNRCEDAGQQSGVSKPLGVVKKLYGLPCANCGSYSSSDEAVCPICQTAVVMQPAAELATSTV